MHGEMVSRGEGCAYARPEQASDLKTIWLRSFPGDTGEDVDAFFSALFRPEECLVYLAEGQPVSMTFALPAVFRAQGESVPVQYIYAASTLPEWRGRGFSGRLLEFTCGQGARQGMAASFLRPGERACLTITGGLTTAPFLPVRSSVCRRGRERTAWSGLCRRRDMPRPGAALWRIFPSGWNGAACRHLTPSATRKRREAAHWKAPRLRPVPSGRRHAPGGGAALSPGGGRVVLSCVFRLRLFKLGDPAAGRRRELRDVAAALPGGGKAVCRCGGALYGPVPGITGITGIIGP